MKHVVAATLLLVALLHALPLAGVLGAARLSSLYGIDVAEPNLALLLRHRAVLFGLLAALLATAALRPALHGAGLMAGLASVGAFLLLALLEGPLNAAVLTVVRLDIAALILLLAAGIVHLVQPAAP
ncbi:MULTISPECIES: hypothetical protein [unclassified Roseateles]|uniref:hypothetical protein n=1 Tax=unclassified Roseateles TaxID=2626991 RepID=UPI0006FFC9AE|nr:MULTISPECIES: hypothetical protein [unclassified Roseateles]KQW45868.1 hypothetical protein ASC81_11195 [Pelomonas sp. Root405]KRA72714.1 hypothetical protein ASD88_11195 [Pelomonas sp. Root662]